MKRLFDLIFSMIFALLLTPVMLIIALFIYFSMGKPIIFVQTRTGLNEKPFNMFKFRTMSPTLDENGNLLSDRLRITKLGCSCVQAALRIARALECNKRRNEYRWSKTSLN